ncbi:hypothetical protein NSA47_02340 [Irregularibacter muris]|uniref:Uncharacterized protein n=1 Tax=Irregularibacter muris TaxID=1796619 RepID=A0AAE3KZ77_9FIRM|nr:hypothetical protein [Irregularibacter muris]MCR1897827.1 hypothetical protein [Irregularibacter muris]
MAKLMTFMYANETRNDFINGQNIQTINTPLLSLKPAFVPGQLSFSVIFGINEFDFAKEHAFQYKLMDPDGNIVVDTGIIQIPPNPNKENIPKIDGFVGDFDLRNVVFMKEGKYKYEVIFDNTKLKDDYIIVKGAGINGNSSKA